MFKSHLDRKIFGYKCKKLTNTSSRALSPQNIRSNSLSVMLSSFPVFHSLELVLKNVNFFKIAVNRVKKFGKPYTKIWKTVYKSTDDGDYLTCDTLNNLVYVNQKVLRLRHQCINPDKVAKCFACLKNVFGVIGDKLNSESGRNWSFFRCKD